ncbi:TPA: Gfo/Idh/MocA family oxidoreductase [archaeon]|uniref:Gfo/Idh/MocA family oxidoreductase n=1 Tax=Candidatus Naiadarchaeum limnaeum TaxID=2756139 RepID=A0A832V2C9_9ARCH|nr:Gfo/Idh/MocA family oxidoreductase [Candidatus Naiadarchaeales archaeon SRR2090153.bin1042]HIK00778.1 Gfo/Idh/MocA family oxidoreductase [Candidatus Naiadarchaeum limnaeum]
MAKLGLIGLGKWGINHARAYSELAKQGVCKFVGIADVNPMARAESDKLGVKFYTDYNQLLKEVDAVSIVVPTNLHYKIVKDCLNAGKHVLVEKPITSNSKEAKELINLAKKKNLLLMVGYLFRFNNAVQILKEMVKDVGQVQYITGRYVHSNKPPRKDSGVILNFAVHLIDILDYLLEKKPKRIYCKKKNFLSKEREDVAFINLDYGDFIANLEVSWFHPQKARDLWIIGERTKIYADLLEQTLISYPIEIKQDEVIERDEKFIEVEKNEPLFDELKYFCAAISDKNLQKNHAQSAEKEYLFTKICEICLKSAQLDQELDVEAELKKNG